MAITILLPMGKAVSTAEMTRLQLMLGNIVAVLCLVLQELFRPYKSRLLNSVERICLTAIALTYALLNCVIVQQYDMSDRLRYALLYLMVGMNVLVMVWLFYQGARQLWSKSDESVSHQLGMLPSGTVRAASGRVLPV